MEFLKKIPLPIWIGLGMVLILIVVVANRSSSAASQQPSTVAGGNTTAAAGPVTTDTVGTQGTQVGAGTDQELGNLSVMTQSGFNQIALQEQQNTQLITQLQNGMSGVGPTMTQWGSSVQNAQTTSAASNAVNGTPGQNAGNAPSAMSNPPNG